jgi:hypothetical protein
VNRGYLVNPPGIQSVSRATRHSSAEMCISVARNAKGNKVLLRIIAGVAAKLFVMDLQVRHRAARLTAPAVTTPNLSAQIVVRDGVEQERRGFRADRIHAAASLSCLRKASFWAINGKNSLHEDHDNEFGLTRRCALSRFSR